MAASPTVRPSFLAYKSKKCDILGWNCIIPNKSIKFAATYLPRFP